LFFCVDNIVLLCLVFHEQNKLKGFAQQVFSSDGGTLLILEGKKVKKKERKKK
jgi:hypothetical protein